MFAPVTPPPVDRRLTDPIGPRLASIEFVDGAESVGRAARRLDESGLPALAVVGPGGEPAGVFDERSLRWAVERGAPPLAPILPLAHPAPAVPAHASGAEALRAMADAGADWVLAVGPDGHPAGILRAGDLYGRWRAPSRPRQVGGMATPFGVYLTNGSIGAGVGFGALMATGALMFAALYAASLAAEAAVNLPALAGWPAGVREVLLGGLTTLLFLLALRLLPLAGTHAAEHMVVHAIERDEPLVPEVVARMPRVHPRCGTNLAAGAMVFLAVNQSGWIGDPSVRLLASVIATLALWRPLGAFLQTWFTTRPPNAAQIDSGIRAGRALLERHARTGGWSAGPHGFGRRLWASGLPAVVAGSLAASLVFELLGRFVPGFPALAVY